MKLVFAFLSLGLIFVVLLDGFEAIILTRRVTHRFRFARFFYRSTWRVWRVVASRIRSEKRRRAFVSLFGPLVLLSLIAFWALGLILGFGVLHWSLETPLHTPDGQHTIGTYLYLSGITFFTVGYGDITPSGVLGRILAVWEAGVGFGFLAVIISYLPVLTQAASRREIVISLLDARAGSPPTGAQALVRVGRTCGPAAFDTVLAEWERWAAELLEAHLSYPGLAYYRSQHDNQSWLGTLTTILDASALLIVGVDKCDTHQAQLTFAMARHAAVDIALVLRVNIQPTSTDRLPSAEFARMRQMLTGAGLELHEDAETRFARMRNMYEPFVAALAHYLLFELPEIAGPADVVDNWQRSAYTPRPKGIGELRRTGNEDHF